MLNLWNRLQRYYYKRRFQRDARTVVQGGKGYVAVICDLSTTTTPETRNSLATDLRFWLRERLSTMATPYGLSQCSISFVVVRKEGSQRTPLWDHQILFQRLQSTQALDQAEHTIRTLPLENLPQATHLEVSLMSMGEILKAAYL